MDKGKYNTESIENYLDGLMKEDELKEFKDDLEVDKELQEDVKLHKRIDEVFMEDDIMNLRMTLDDIHEKTYKRPLRNKIWTPLVKKLSYAASFLAVVAIVILLTLTTNKSPEKVFTEYYKPYEVQGVVRSVNTVNDEILMLAIQRYQEANFDAAARLFQQVLKKDNANMQLHLYSGISNMELEKYKQANESFEVILKDKDNFYIEHAEWYLGLCYLKMNEIDVALNYFRKIAGSDSYYNEKATQIIKKLS